MKTSKLSFERIFLNCNQVTDTLRGKAKDRFKSDNKRLG